MAIDATTPNATTRNANVAVDSSGACSAAARSKVIHSAKHLRWCAPLLLAALAACAATAPKEAVATAAPKDIPASARNTFTFALAAMRAQQWGEAESQLKTLIQAQPNLSGAYLNLALVYAQTKRPVDAEIQFKKAIEVNADNAAARDQYGIWLRTEGRFKDAESQYLQNLQRHADRADTHLNLGILYDLYMGKSAAALEQYQQYLTLQSESSDPMVKTVSGWVVELKRRNGTENKG